MVTVIYTSVYCTFSCNSLDKALYYKHKVHRFVPQETHSSSSFTHLQICGIHMIKTLVWNNFRVVLWSIFEDKSLKNKCFICIIGLNRIWMMSVFSHELDCLSTVIMCHLFSPNQTTSCTNTVNLMLCLFVEYFSTEQWSIPRPSSTWNTRNLLYFHHIIHTSSVQTVSISNTGN